MLDQASAAEQVTVVDDCSADQTRVARGIVEETIGEGSAMIEKKRNGGSWKKDLARYGNGTGALAFFKMLTYCPGFRFTFLFRKASLFGRRSIIGLPYRMLLSLIHI